MKVGIVTAYHEPIGFNHGVLQFCRLAESAALGVTPTLIAMTRGAARVNGLVAKARDLGLRLETLHEEFPYDPRVLPRLVELIDRNGFQLLDLQTYKPLALGLLARRVRRRVSIVSWVHGFTEENLKIRLFSAVEKRLHRLSDRVICVSQGFAEVIAGHGVPSSGIEVIPNAIGDEEFEAADAPERLRQELGLPRDALVVGAIGRLSPEKGHTMLIRAWQPVVAQHPSARLLIVGDGPCRAKLQEETRGLGLQDSVVFTGFRPDARRLYPALDLLALPSLAEGLPYVLLEAMVKEVPVVATAVGEVPTVLEAGRVGRLVPPGSAEELAAKIAQLLAQPLERKMLAAEARKSVLARYSHQARARLIIGAYRQAAGADSQ